MKLRKQSRAEVHSMCTEQLTQRVKMGDVLSSPREVDHTAYFRKRSDAATAAAELSRDGFVVRVARRGLGAFLLEASATTDVEWDTVDSFVDRVYELVTRHNGVYDGWGGGIVLRSEP